LLIRGWLLSSLWILVSTVSFLSFGGYIGSGSIANLTDLINIAMDLVNIALDHMDLDPCFGSMSNSKYILPRALDQIGMY
jgi:hypothetical protein